MNDNGESVDYDTLFDLGFLVDDRVIHLRRAQQVVAAFVDDLRSEVGEHVRARTTRGSRLRAEVDSIIQARVGDLSDDLVYAVDDTGSPA